jgi:hypothetical protein
MRSGWMRVTIAGAAIVTALMSVAPPARAEPQRGATLRGVICRMVDAAAESNRLPTAFLTRVLWQESRFRTDVTSPAGAAGVAQFMPATAAERGLADPYDPGPAISKAAALLAELAGRFGNLGLAAAGYNAGAARVSKWLHAQSGLPAETQLYVLAVTGRRVEDWRAASDNAPDTAERGSCLDVTADLTAPATRFTAAPTVPARTAAWQLRLDEFLARAVRLQQQRPGTVPISSRNRAAEVFCDRIRAMGTPCAVYER